MPKMPDLELCRICGTKPEEDLQHVGHPHVAYECCEISTRHYRGRKTAREVWNRWQRSAGMIPSGPPTQVECIGYDVDGVLCNIKEALIRKARSLGYVSIPDHRMEWREYYPEWCDEAWQAIENNHTWWTRLNPYDDAYIFTDVDYYITARDVPRQLTEQWLVGNGFPRAPVYSVDREEKVEMAKEKEIDLFVDDHAETVREMNRNGVFCLLRDRPHNWDANGLHVNDRRIRCLSQVQEYV